MSGMLVKAARAAALAPAPLHMVSRPHENNIVAFGPNCPLSNGRTIGETFCISCPALKQAALKQKEDERNEKVRQPNLSISAQLHPQDGTSFAHQF
ncbi:hypothetical protein EN745_00260 [Mesorhizobium sp. M4A.F.Ca.ET.022.05.2.1]|uniref:hypothetical protein n=1 Tax=Mesorhizobium sp. M4A.F.Ca.ET.022.05.2.1 TaxID=2496653 RepID=UPI000FCBB469|nr:hypothetical protein [Mesorhizobium sp. M4A.F.Ca.ET.022.05.2.1]RVC84020.1 hypothetical protein EN745_00260 [Mesorhizobium sp. M4A.F.Ca.ET.022.05.2.1]